MHFSWISLKPAMAAVVATPMCIEYVEYLEGSRPMEDTRHLMFWFKTDLSSGEPLGEQINNC